MFVLILDTSMYTNAAVTVFTGTPLYASHFRVGDYVDVQCKTWVLQRWWIEVMIMTIMMTIWIKLVQLILSVWLHLCTSAHLYAVHVTVHRLTLCYIVRHTFCICLILLLMMMMMDEFTYCGVSSRTARTRNSNRGSCRSQWTGHVHKSEWAVLRLRKNLGLQSTVENWHACYVVYIVYLCEKLFSL